jgi:transposase
VLQEHEEVPLMAIVGAFDVHRAQLTYDYVSTETGEVRRGQVKPADREHLRRWLARFEGEQEVAFAVEACTGWRYVVEELRRAGCEVHLAEPADLSREKGPKQRAKTDAADARHLRELLSQGRVPESWIPPAGVLEARGLVRLYMDLTEERAGWIQRIHAALFHQGVAKLESVLDAPGRALLPGVELSPAGRRAVEVGLRQIERLGAEIKVLGKEIGELAQAQPACRALVKAHYGVGPILAFAIWAEMGDPRRFSSSSDAVRYAGIDITVYSSDGKRSRGHLSRQGPPLLRWALYEAALQASRVTSPDHAYYETVKARRQSDAKIAVLAVARKLARRCYHTLRELGPEAWPAAA